MVLASCRSALFWSRWHLPGSPAIQHPAGGSGPADIVLSYVDSQVVKRRWKSRLRLITEMEHILVMDQEAPNCFKCDEERVDSAARLSVAKCFRALLGADWSPSASATANVDASDRGWPIADPCWPAQQHRQANELVGRTIAHCVCDMSPEIILSKPRRLWSIGTSSN